MPEYPTENSPVSPPPSILSPLTILGHFADLIRLPNQTGTLLLLLPSLWALVLASKGSPDPALLAVFTLGAFFMRSAGVVVNDLADRFIDRKVSRTRYRPLACGTISPKQALLVVAVLSLLAASLLLFLPPLAIALSPIAILLATLYPFSKRVFHMPQLILGVTFGWGVVMAWAAVRNQIEFPMWLLFAATVFWAIAYDTIYALQDREDDLKIGVKSSAILFGAWTWLSVGGFLGLMLLSLGLAAWWMQLSPGFYGVLAGIGGFLSQQVWRLRGEVGQSLAFSMFKQHIWIGLVILAGIWVSVF